MQTAKRKNKENSYQLKKEYLQHILSGKKGGGTKNKKENIYNVLPKRKRNNVKYLLINLGEIHTHTQDKLKANESGYLCQAGQQGMDRRILSICFI